MDCEPMDWIVMEEPFPYKVFLRADAAEPATPAFPLCIALDSSEPLTPMPAPDVPHIVDAVFDIDDCANEGEVAVAKNANTKNASCRTKRITPSLISKQKTLVTAANGPSEHKVKLGLKIYDMSLVNTSGVTAQSILFCKNLCLNLLHL